MFVKSGREESGVGGTISSSNTSLDERTHEECTAIGRACESSVAPVIWSQTGLPRSRCLMHTMWVFMYINIVPRTKART